MILEEEKYILNDKEVVLRSARLDEAQMLIDYLKTVTGETRFLMCEPNEIEYTRSQEEQFIKSHNESKDALLILAFVDGEYAGNCSFESRSGCLLYKRLAAQDGKTIPYGNLPEIKGLHRADIESAPTEFRFP